MMKRLFWIDEMEIRLFNISNGYKPDEMTEHVAYLCDEEANSR